MGKAGGASCGGLVPVLLKICCVFCIDCKVLVMCKVLPFVGWGLMVCCCGGFVALGI